MKWFKIIDVISPFIITLLREAKGQKMNDVMNKIVIGVTIAVSAGAVASVIQANSDIAVLKGFMEKGSRYTQMDADKDIQQIQNQLESLRETHDIAIRNEARLESVVNMLQRIEFTVNEDANRG